VDVSQITNEALLGFDGTFEMVAVLDADNVWSVRSGQG
jgi:hypothetical protein